MKSRPSDQSSAGEQAESSPKEHGAHRKRPSDRELERMGFRPVKAFVRAAVMSDEPPDAAGDDAARPKTAAERKEKQREEDMLKGHAHFDVKVPKKDQAVKDTIKAIAASALGDRQLYSAVAEMAADASLRTLVSLVAATPQLLPLMAEIVRHVEVRTLVEAMAADQVLAHTLSDLVSAGSLPAEAWAAIVSEINRVAADGVATSVVADAVAAALREPDTVIKSAEVTQRGGIRGRMLGWILAL